ncbi:TetR family transcriptional regulator [Mycobacterium spongiae]|uniref:TetR family transcriptional regulator n=1 Tax=Mycobacterium spongiae TaxID=886343 RepID=A0A975PXT9_9MYCO|nr:TetR family transcriptional regulator [Mycobacterium spongiae]QUR68174.1 TetR family transcriptional regulator [Mycobacterium spongiae]
MAQATKITDFQRARSDDQKARRRQAIVTAARQHLADVGFESFSMGTLAKAVGIARGTLYLYFETREEVLLALYVEEIQLWVDAVIDATPAGTGAEPFLAAFFRTATDAPLYLQLAARAGSVIEQNISLQRLIDLKMAARDLAFRVGEHVATLFELTPEQAIGVVTSLLSLLLGVSQMTHPLPVEQGALPPQVQELVQMMDAERLFLDAGLWMLNGVRR